MAASLYELTGPKSKFHWIVEYQATFEKSWDCLECALTLSYSNNNDAFILDTDDIVTGTELLQLEDGKENVIPCRSFSLTPGQCKHCTTHKKLLAEVQFLMESCLYLLRHKFVIRTDHSSLTWLMHFKHIKGQLARRLEEVNQFNMEIQHHPGHKHCNADGLSCIPQEEYCNYSKASVDIHSLPCGHCKYCIHMQNSGSNLMMMMTMMMMMMMMMMYPSLWDKFKWQMKMWRQMKTLLVMLKESLHLGCISTLQNNPVRNSYRIQIFLS